MNDNGFQHHVLFASLSLLGMLVGIFNTLTHLVLINTLPFSLLIFMLSSLFLGIIFNILMFKKFVVGFLFAAFFTLISSRIAALYDFYYLSIPLIFTVIIMVIYYWS